MENSTKIKVFNAFASSMLVAPILTTSLSVMAQEVENDLSTTSQTVVYHNDFETDADVNDGIMKPASNAVLEWFADDTETGVMVTNRNADYDGIDIPFEALDIDVADGVEYSIQVLGFIEEGTDIPAGAQMTLETVDGYSWLNNKPAEEGVFELNAMYSSANANDADHSFRIKTNSEGSGMEFAVTDILITTEEDEVNLETLYHATFEEGNEGTVGAGAEVQHIDGAMSVTNRSANWHGLDIPNSVSGMAYGYTYDVTIKGSVDEHADIPEGAQAWLQVPEADYPLLSEADFVAGEEFILTDTFTVTNEAYTKLRVQSNDSGATVDFDVTEVLIEWNPNQTPIIDEEPDPDAPPAEEFTFIDFENGELNGVEGRSGEETLLITDEENHTPDGQYSLHISDRANNWHGPSLEVTPYINAGETYEVSVWVKVDTESSQRLTLSTQVGDGSAAAYNNIASVDVSAADGWVEITGEYRYTSLGGGFVSIYVESNNINLDFYVDDVNFQQIESDPVEVDLELASLKEVYKNHFRIGNAVSMPDLEGPRADLLTHHHNLVTAENAMKPGEVYDGREFDFSGSNLLADRVEELGLDLHGHVLVWHSQSPEWHHTENGSPLSREVALENMRVHIETVMENFGELTSWDVVNEALDGSWANPEDWEANLRNTGWLRAIGDDYIYQAFRIAREYADSQGWHDMVLYYNDYNDHVQPKARTMYHMIKDINDQWAAENPDETRKLISGVGMQGHYSININPDTVEQSIERFTQLGIEIGITELDVTTNTNNVYDADEINRQAYIYARLFQIFRKYSEHIDRVTFWGLNDANSWRSDRFPLLFDGSLRAKPAYYAVVDPDGFLEEYEEDTVSANQGYAVFGTPTIDAEIDTVWENARVLPMNRMQQAHEIGARGNARVLWDNDYLYVLYEVTDGLLDSSAADAHEQDSVEAFINETGESTTEYVDGVGQYRVNYLGDESFNPGRYSEGFQSVARQTGSGYVVEMAIPWKEVTPAAGHTLGFDVQINDARDGERHGVAAWNDMTGMGWSDPSVFGRLTLVNSTDPEEPTDPEDGKPGKDKGDDHPSNTAPGKQKGDDHPSNTAPGRQKGDNHPSNRSGKN